MRTKTVPMKKPAARNTSNLWKYITGGAVVLVLLIAAGWYWASRESPEVTRIKELGQQLFAEDGNLSGDDRQRMFGEMRELRENLSEGQRDQLRSEVMSSMRRRMSQEIDGYFELPEQERDAYLDQQIQRMEQMRANFANRGGGPDGQGGGPPWAGGGGDDRRRGGGGEGTSRRRWMLDNTTPEQRAKFTEYMKAMNERRKEKGLQPMGPPGRGRG